MSPRANPPQTQRKLTPGSMGGDRAVQPGVHVVILPGPPAPLAADLASVCIPGIPFTAIESFNKADGTLGPVLTWTVTSGTIEVVSNECAENSGAAGAGSSASPSLSLDRNMLVSVEVRAFAGITTDNPLLLHARVIGGNFVYLLIWKPGTGAPNRWELGTDGGIVASATVPWLTPGNIVGLETSGATATAYLNGVSQVTGAIPAGSAGSPHSCSLFLSDGGTIDNFHVEGETACP